MAWRSAGSASRSFFSAAARAPSLRSTPPRFRPSQSSLPRRRYTSFMHSRNLGELGCVESLLPLHNVVAASRLTSHLNVNIRAFCELSNGDVSFMPSLIPLVGCNRNVSEKETVAFTETALHDLRRQRYTILGCLSHLKSRLRN